MEPDFGCDSTLPSEGERRVIRGGRQAHVRVLTHAHRDVRPARDEIIWHIGMIVLRGTIIWHKRRRIVICASSGGRTSGTKRLGGRQAAAGVNVRRFL